MPRPAIRQDPIPHPTGRNDEAVTCATELLDIDPEDTTAYGLRGSAYYHLGENAAALKDFDSAIRLRPDFAWVYSWRGHVYQKDDEHELAIVEFTRSIELDDRADTRAARAASYADLDHFDESIADYTEAIRLQPTPQWLVGRGDQFAEHDQPQRAIGDYTEAIRIDADYRWAYRARAQLLEELGQLDRAEADNSTNVSNLKACRTRLSLQSNPTWQDHKRSTNCW